MPVFKNIFELGVKIAFWNKKQIKVKNSAVRGSKDIWGMERYGFMSLK